MFYVIKLRVLGLPVFVFLRLAIGTIPASDNQTNRHTTTPYCVPLQHGVAR